jgi:hypothetical protein
MQRSVLFPSCWITLPKKTNSPLEAQCTVLSRLSLRVRRVAEHRSEASSLASSP